MGLTSSRPTEAELQQLQRDVKNSQLYDLQTSFGSAATASPQPSRLSHHTRSGSVRGPPRQPMPDALELERRFTKVLVSTHAALQPLGSWLLAGLFNNRCHFDSTAVLRVPILLLGLQNVPSLFLPTRVQRISFPESPERPRQRNATCELFLPAFLPSLRYFARSSFGLLATTALADCCDIRVFFRDS